MDLICNVFKKIPCDFCFLKTACNEKVQLLIRRNILKAEDHLSVDGKSRARKYFLLIFYRNR